MSRNDVTTNKKILRKPLIRYKSRIVGIEDLILRLLPKNLGVPVGFLVFITVLFIFSTLHKRSNLENRTLSTPVDLRLSA